MSAPCNHLVQRIHPTSADMCYNQPGRLFFEFALQASACCSLLFYLIWIYTLLDVQPSGLTKLSWGDSWAISQDEQIAADLELVCSYEEIELFSICSPSFSSSLSLSLSLLISICLHVTPYSLVQQAPGKGNKAKPNSYPQLVSIKPFMSQDPSQSFVRKDQNAQGTPVCPR